MNSKPNKFSSSEGWDVHAEDFNKLHKEVGFTAKISAEVLELTFPQDIEDIRIVDVAAGSGALTLLAGRKMNNKGYVLGTDFSPKMIEKLKENIVEQKLKNVEAKVMDGQVLFLL